ncbi:MAG: hypothetical protein AABX07_05125 [Nanoarchaeota archaeon]
MQKEILNFIEANNLSPFSKYNAQVKANSDSIFKTKDAKQIYNKVLSKLSSNFHFSDTSDIWNFFEFTNNLDEIRKRQEFFKKSNRIENNFLKELSAPKPYWKPKYSIVVATEDENILMRLKELGCPVQFLISEYDLQSLMDYDTVQVIGCEMFSHALEKLPQTIFLRSIDEAYLERYLQILSGWKANLEVLGKFEANEEVRSLVSEISPLLGLLEDKTLKITSKEAAEAEIERMNEEIFSQIKNMTLSGDLFLSILNKNQLPNELKELIRRTLAKNTMPESVIDIGIPLKLNQKELENLIKNQSANEFSSIAENIKKHALQLKKLPENLRKLSELLILLDFVSGVSRYVLESHGAIEISDELLITSSENFLLENPKPISFHLDANSRCSMLTGANSGGKTTLLEHIIQFATLFHLGLPIKGNAKMPLFSEIYYFAKTKGSANKGAFETLLTQMSEIKPGKKTLILADEIEAVTEPGVAGKIISATAEYFINKNCFLVIATHLGQEIKDNLPQFARIDGIEAKGLDEFNELIVDHNPILGRLAHSTPELIIEKMSNTKKTDYLRHLHSSIKKR